VLRDLGGRIMGMKKILSSTTPESIRIAATSLIGGNLIAFPTETVYGLGADAVNKDAVARIYQTKARPSNHPLIVHIATLNNLHKWARNIPDDAFKLATTFWPGPITLILLKTNIAKDFITGGQDKIGIRIPSHPVALALLKEFEKQGGLGVAAPSANRFGAVSPTTAEDVHLELGEYLSHSDVILDGGKCNIGIESTIVDFTQDKPMILRPGKISKETINEVLGLDVGISSSKNETKTSGLLDSHYSPKAKVFLSGFPKPGDGYIALAKNQTPVGVIRLSSPNNNDEYAQFLYTAFRLADSKKINNIFAIPAEGGGIADAINDRLRKAAFNKDDLKS
jgi:L-threonylcarbamoyladenylate synthase